MAHFELFRRLGDRVDELEVTGSDGRQIDCAIRRQLEGIKQSMLTVDLPTPV